MVHPDVVYTGNRQAKYQYIEGCSGDPQSSPFEVITIAFRPDADAIDHMRNADAGNNLDKAINSKPKKRDGLVFKAEIDRNEAFSQVIQYCKRNQPGGCSI